MCFKERDNLVPLRVEGKAADNHVCKGCWYEIDKIIGFLSESGLIVSWPQDKENKGGGEGTTPKK